MIELSISAICTQEKLVGKKKIKEKRKRKYLEIFLLYQYLLGFALFFL